jgi:hypothetical protein
MLLMLRASDSWRTSEVAERNSEELDKVVECVDEGNASGGKSASDWQVE